MDNYGVVEEWTIKVTNRTGPAPCNVRVRLGCVKDGETLGTFEAEIRNLAHGAPTLGAAYRVAGGMPARSTLRLLDLQLLNEGLESGSP